jgi:hypothetical protein
VVRAGEAMVGAVGGGAAEHCEGVAGERPPK